MPNICKTVNRWFFGTIVGAGCTAWSFACMATAYVFNNETVTNNSEIIAAPNTEEIINYNGTINNGTSSEAPDVDLAIELSIPSVLLFSLLCYLLYAKCLQDYSQDLVTSHNLFCCVCDLFRLSKCCKKKKSGEEASLRPHTILPSGYDALGEMQQPVAEDDNKGSLSP